MGAAVSALTLTALLAVAGPALAATSSGTTSCGSFRAAKIVATTGAGTTTFYWGQLGGGYTDAYVWGNWPAGTKSYGTGINNITWKVTAPSISSAYGSCYYA